MRKVKFFGSLYRERDWLEQMAAKGWLLENLTLGIIYRFKKIEPAQKVFEIERFGVSEYPKKQELTARKTALDIARQAGWEEVTHDEEMNYYFVKDKEGDENDEFFADEETRMGRAEKYRRRYGLEQPFILLILVIVSSLIYIPLFFDRSPKVVDLMAVYIIFDICMVVLMAVSIWWAQRMYYELSMTRQRWEQWKRYGKKKSFTKAGKLVEWLKENEEKGLILSDFEEGTFLFEEGSQCYDYFVDTKHALSKRLKKQGLKFIGDKKDLNGQSTQWYEMSIEQAEAAELELVCAVEKGTLLYRRKHSEALAPFDTAGESIGILGTMMRAVSIVTVTAFAVGFIVGILAAMLG